MDMVKNVTNLLIVRNWSTMLVLDIKGVDNGDGQKMLQICLLLEIGQLC